MVAWLLPTRMLNPRTSRGVTCWAAPPGPPPSPGELFNTIQNWKGPEKNCFSLSFINILLTFLRKQIKKYDIITF